MLSKTVFPLKSLACNVPIPNANQGLRFTDTNINAGDEQFICFTNSNHSKLVDGSHLTVETMVGFTIGPHLYSGITRHDRPGLAG